MPIWKAGEPGWIEGLWVEYVRYRSNSVRFRTYWSKREKRIVSLHLIFLSGIKIKSLASQHSIFLIRVESRFIEIGGSPRLFVSLLMEWSDLIKEMHFSLRDCHASLAMTQGEIATSLPSTQWQFFSMRLPSLFRAERRNPASPREIKWNKKGPGPFVKYLFI